MAQEKIKANVVLTPDMQAYIDQIIIPIDDRSFGPSAFIEYALSLLKAQPDDVTRGKFMEWKQLLQRQQAQERARSEAGAADDAGATAEARRGKRRGKPGSGRVAG